jgi:pilus assembly protein CpaC
MSNRSIKHIITLVGVLVLAVAAVAPRVGAEPKMSSSMTQGAAQDTKFRILNVSLNQARSVKLPVKVNDVVIADPTIADVVVKKQDLVFVFARSVGSTVIYFLDDSGDIVLKTEVRVQLDTKAIEDALKNLLPNADIKVTAYRDSVFLSGVINTANEATNAEDIVRRFVNPDTNVSNMLTLRGDQQVILQVKVAEVARTVRKALAVNQPFTSNVAGISINAINPFGLTNFTAEGGFGGTLNLGQPSSLFGFGAATLRVLEQNGLAKTLAEPSLTAISGETANFLAGGEFPFPSGSDQNGNVTIEFRDFGIALNFTPVVLDGGRINLQIATEISSINDDLGLPLLGLTVPGITTRRTDTTVELPSGGTIMLSGLMQEDGTNRIRGAPYLMDIPVLGALFRSSEFTQNHTELLIIVSAYLAKSVDGSTKLSLPNDGFPPASDVDLYMLGKLHGEYMGGKAPMTPIPLSGPFGYIME